MRRQIAVRVPPDNEFLEEEEKQDSGEHPAHQRRRLHALRQRMWQDVQKHHCKHCADGERHPALNRGELGVQRKRRDCSGGNATQDGGNNDGE